MVETVMERWRGDRLCVLIGMALTVSILATGCMGLPPTIPEIEAEQLLALRWSPGLSRDQAIHIRTLLSEYRAHRRTMALHVGEESRTLGRRLATKERIDDPELLAEINLVHQLRAEQVEAQLVFRERTRGLLTAQQQDWLDVTRLRPDRRSHVLSP
jgi:hypothetical protein